MQSSEPHHQALLSTPPSRSGHLSSVWRDWTTFPPWRSQEEHSRSSTHPSLWSVRSARRRGIRGLLIRVQRASHMVEEMRVEWTTKYKKEKNEIRKNNWFLKNKRGKGNEKIARHKETNNNPCPTNGTLKSIYTSWWVSRLCCSRTSGTTRESLEVFSEFVLVCFLRVAQCRLMVSYRGVKGRVTFYFHSDTSEAVLYLTRCKLCAAKRGRWWERLRCSLKRMVWRWRRTTSQK